MCGLTRVTTYVVRVNIHIFDNVLCPFSTLLFRGRYGNLRKTLYQIVQQISGGVWRCYTTTNVFKKGTSQHLQEQQYHLLLEARFHLTFATENVNTIHHKTAHPIRMEANGAILQIFFIKPFIADIKKTQIV